ncbi:MAG: DUF559 domain-containing protein [Acidimicrobiales bacterium]|nr:DUF559 domain-containing protein [Acidimicrobiales bacterium]
MDDVATLFRRAQTFHGVFTTRDALELGITAKRLRTLVVRGMCERVARGVYRVAGAPRTPQQALAAALAQRPGAVLSHQAAGWAWSLPGFRSAAAVITLERRGNQRHDHGWVRTTGWLPPAHVRMVDRLPVTSVPRTLFDIAGIAPVGRTARALDHALSRRMCSLDDVRTVHELLARRGRRGTVVLRTLLDERSDGRVAPASELERRARAVFQTGGLPEPDYEVDLGDDEWAGRVDCLWREARLVVELDGRRYHEGRTSREDDRRRDNRLMAQGWRVLRFTWDDLQERPGEVVRLIRRALEGH